MRSATRERRPKENGRAMSAGKAGMSKRVASGLARRSSARTRSPYVAAAKVAKRKTRTKRVDQVARAIAIAIIEVERGRSEKKIRRRGAHATTPSPDESRKKGGPRFRRPPHSMQLFLVVRSSRR